METSMQMYLAARKEQTGMSWAELSAATGLPDSTIRKIFSGDTADPRLETISLIVSAMGGSLDAMREGIPEPVKAAEPSEDSQLLRESYEKRIEEIKAAAERHANSLKKDKLVLFIVVCILTAFLLLFLIADLMLGSVGWIRY